MSGTLLGRRRRELATARSSVVQVRWERQDRHRVLTRLGVVALLGLVWLRLYGPPPLELLMPLHELGVMDPLCGATRALTAAVRGELALAVRYHPPAPLLVLGVFLLSVRVAAGVATGRWATVRFRPSRLWAGVLVVPGAGLWLNQEALPAMEKQG